MRRPLSLTKRITSNDFHAERVIIRTVCAYIAPVRRNDIKFLHFTFVDSVAQNLNMTTNDRVSVNSFYYRL